MAYSAAVFQNCGNYKAFGDTKFVPEIPPEDFRSFIQQTEAYKRHQEVVEVIWKLIEREVYTESDPYRILGFKDNNGTTSYYSANVTSADAKKVDEFCQEKKISPLNTRLVKLQEGEYELRIASAESSAEKTPYLKTYTHTLSQENGRETITVHVKAGDFHQIMSKVVENM
jgi:dipeptidyl-peptidase-3